MKKIITLFSLIAVGLTAQANPRTIRLSIALNSPANNATYAAGNNISEDFVITNLGPDNIIAADTLAFEDPTNNSGEVYILMGYTKNVNDTIHITNGLTVPTDATNGTFNFCVGAYVQNGSDVVLDSVYSKCNSITITGGNNAGVASIIRGSSNAKLSFSPNPANNEINIDYKASGSSDVVATVYDVTGRTVYTYNFGKARSNFNLNVSGLKTGLYMVEMSQDGKRAVGKLNKL